MEKEDFHKEFKDEIGRIQKEGKRPTLFLHACCGPCLTYPLSVLTKYFSVTVGYFNPNIRPEKEYILREKTLEDFVSRYSKDNGIEVPVVLHEEDFRKYDSLFSDRWKDHEGGRMCLKCHAYRRERAYRYAFEHHFDYFTTVRTVSSKKPSRELNEIAKRLEKEYPSTKYLYSDFKKEDGRLKGIRISREYSLYRQGYCGCLPSLEERKKIIQAKRNEGKELTQSEKDLRILE